MIKLKILILACAVLYLSGCLRDTADIPDHRKMLFFNVSSFQTVDSVPNIIKLYQNYYPLFHRRYMVQSTLSGHADFMSCLDVDSSVWSTEVTPAQLAGFPHHLRFEAHGTGKFDNPIDPVYYDYLGLNHEVGNDNSLITDLSKIQSGYGYNELGEFCDWISNNHSGNTLGFDFVLADSCFAIPPLVGVPNSYWDDAYPHYNYTPRRIFMNAGIATGNGDPIYVQKRYAYFWSHMLKHKTEYEETKVGLGSNIPVLFGEVNDTAIPILIQYLQERTQGYSYLTWGAICDKINEDLYNSDKIYYRDVHWQAVYSPGVNQVASAKHLWAEMTFGSLPKKGEKNE